jgi:hypothetical protein
MTAWRHYNKWTDGFYKKYRADVSTKAPKLEKRKEDCADLSIKLLIEFAARNGLPVTFKDADGFLYVSKATAPLGPNKMWRPSQQWFSADMYTSVVQSYIQTKALWLYNTLENSSGPEPGDLMMKYSTNPIIHTTHDHHTALVFTVYPPLTPHPNANLPIPSFPGREKASSQYNVTQYFMGTVDKDNDWITAYRTPDTSIHFDYLNSRGSAKRNAELIYYANYAQLRAEGFEFRRYAPLVLDNWADWNGEGWPPRGLEPVHYYHPYRRPLR